MHKDSIIEEYSQTDFKNLKSQDENKIDDFNLAEMIRTNVPFTINDRGFNLLINQTNELNNKYKNHIEKLFFLYQNVRVDIDHYNKNLENLLVEHRM
ncbi:hypothetical protein [Polaribacter glomeratus]|uniref:Uncharacterized protein n=1 Tax=Polaribacter glomeratus TaxID=102 RepID=A0A2S7WWS4_9FLAO|nr:hypothetical protein [Polaribacter glomeratus]PQJ82007.1 hypothetical protein BTO16_05215 [Polaribacter glomeratus]TXD66600.1 hypothetical protein ESX12_03525 [Polaribacter glomeratus]